MPSYPMGALLRTPQLRLRTLFVLTAIAAVAIPVYLTWRGDSLTTSLRHDLRLASGESLSILESTSTGDGDSRGDTLLILLKSDTDYRLASVSRTRVSSSSATGDSSWSPWVIDYVSMMDVEGNCLFHRFERSFPNEPSPQDIAEFKRSLDNW